MIRISYGPFRLNDLQPGEVEEVKGKVLRDQLGQGATVDEDAPKRTRAPRPASRTTTGKAEGASSGKRLKAGEGLKQLSDAWGEATKPRRFGTAAAKADAPADKPRSFGTAAKKAETAAVRPAKPPVKRASPDAGRANRAKACRWAAQTWRVRAAIPRFCPLARRGGCAYSLGVRVVRNGGVMSAKGLESGAFMLLLALMVYVAIRGAQGWGRGYGRTVWRQVLAGKFQNRRCAGGCACAGYACAI